MKYKVHFLPVFLLCLVFSFLIFFVGRFGIFGFLQSSVQQTFFPLDTLVFSAFHAPLSKPSEVNLLKEENLALHQQLAQMDALKQDNEALKDQFQISSPSPKQLIPVAVVGMMGSFPNVSFPETIIIGKGSADGVTVGQVAVKESAVVGQVTSVSFHYSVVELVSAKTSSFPAQTSATSAIGVVKGQGNGEMTLDNVLLSDVLKNGDTVVTKGSQDVSGKGYPPNLVVGKIVGIDKNPSNLFQTARVVPLVSFDHLTTVFLLAQ